MPITSNLKLQFVNNSGTAHIDKDALAAAIGRELGKEGYLKNDVDPGLVGGVRVFVANRMIDNSVQGRLAGLQRKLREARLSAG